MLRMTRKFMLSQALLWFAIGVAICWGAFGQAKTSRLALSFLPVGLPFNVHTVDVIRASGFDGFQLYQTPLNAAALPVFARAAQLGMKLDLMWSGSTATVDWLAALPISSRPAVGLFNVAPDEPDATSCPAACIANIQALYNYAGSQVSWVTRNVNISAYAAYFQDWTYADIVYTFADVPTSDFYGHCWSAGDPTIVPLLVQRTRTHVFPKPVAFFSDGGPLRPDECAGTGLPYPLTSAFLIQQFFAIQAAGASVIIWWFTPGWPGAVQFGDIHWRTMVAAADQIRPVASDVNADGVVTMVDYRLAREATNEALAGRIKAQLRFAWVPMVLRP